MNSYSLSSAWFEFAFENPEKINPNHTALYFWCIEVCNRMNWKEKFSLPSAHTMEAIGIKSYNTFIKTFNDLIEFGFIKLIQKSTNQYTANVIALSNFDKAQVKASRKHIPKQVKSTGESIDSIDKQLTIKHNNIEYESDHSFDTFWNLYPKKISKKKCITAWRRLNDTDRSKILETLPGWLKMKPDLTFLPHPLTYLNGERWNDDTPKVSAIEAMEPKRKQILYP